MRALGVFCAGWLVCAAIGSPAAADIPGPAADDSPPAVVRVEAAPPKPMPSAGSAELLIELYGPRTTAEIRRLRDNLERKVFVVFDVGIGYIQCQPQNAPDVIYCEAQSPGSSAALASVLTPDRVAKLRSAGYADPGRSPNYWKDYPLDNYDDAVIAKEVITLLHDVYGYTGSEQLTIKTEAGREP
jgi:type III secretion system-like peptide-binding chaperone